jgi:hypothetical protein
VREDVSVCKGDYLVLHPRSVSTKKVNQRVDTRRSKGHSKPTFTHLPDSSHIMPATPQRQNSR